MGSDPSDSHHMQLKQSEVSNYQIDNLGNLIAALLLNVDPRLPPELIFEILLRLPLKSLLKFKCVSKSWLSLISSPRFVKSHFSVSSELNSQVLIIPEIYFSFNIMMLPPTWAGIKQISLYSALYEDEPSAYVSDIDYPYRKAYKDISVVGIINGLVCLMVEAMFYLWNPALRNYKLLPRPDVTLKKFFFLVYGFGYDELNDDYKVVYFVSDDYLYGSDNVAVIYSLLTNSWRIIEDYKGHLPVDFSGKYANGKIHWLVGTSPLNWKITSLDMVSDKFGEMLLPEYEAGVSKSADMVFGVSSERLFLLCKYNLKKTDLWVMEKYGVQESWSKVVSIPYDNLNPTKSGVFEYAPQVVCILRNGEIVLSDGWDLIVFDSKHKDFRKIELGEQITCRFHVYVESLVSPNGLSAL